MFAEIAADVFLFSFFLYPYWQLYISDTFGPIAVKLRRMIELVCT